jgi:hypothetical protein
MEDPLPTDSPGELESLLEKGSRLASQCRQRGPVALPFRFLKRKSRLQSWITLLVLASTCSLGLLTWKTVCLVLGSGSRDHFSTKSRNPAYLIEARHGAVASENERCSIMGVDIMKEGGNAVDAAVAAAFCTGVVNMFS